MTSLVDESYYTDVYKGAEVEGDLSALLERASDIVRQHTLYKLDGAELEKMPSFMREYIKKAVCAEAEYISANGGLDMLNAGGAASFSIGKFSMSGGVSGSGSGCSPPAAPLTVSYLEAAGLLYRGI